MEKKKDIYLNGCISVILCLFYQMSSIISARPFGLYHHLHKSNLQRLPFLLVKAMGYSSFIAVIVSMIVYWYKKQLAHQSRLESLKKEKQAITLAVHDECRLNPKKKLHITTTNHGLRRTSSSLKRTSSTMTNLANERHVCIIFYCVKYNL